VVAEVRRQDRLGERVHALEDLHAAPHREPHHEVSRVDRLALAGARHRIDDGGYRREIEPGAHVG
jgi:hypothetical protein